jgi:hypothetical protein
MAKLGYKCQKWNETYIFGKSHFLIILVFHNVLFNIDKNYLKAERNYVFIFKNIKVVFRISKLK